LFLQSLAQDVQGAVRYPLRFEISCRLGDGHQSAQAQARQFRHRLRQVGHLARQKSGLGGLAADVDLDAHLQRGQFGWPLFAQTLGDLEPVQRMHPVERLRDGVKADVQRRNSLLVSGDGWKFEFDEDDDGFEAVRVVAQRFIGSSGSAAVRFERIGPRIQIQGDGIDVDLTAVVTLDATGACRLVIGEAMYAEWEVRRLALELLFFEESEDAE